MKTHIEDIVTSSLDKFARHHLIMAAELITKYIDNRDVLGDEVKLQLNRNSGCVFLGDEDYNAAMINKSKEERPIESWYVCSECGFEGFKMNFEIDTDSKCCKKVIEDA